MYIWVLNAVILFFFLYRSIYLKFVNSQKSVKYNLQILVWKNRSDKRKCSTPRYPIVYTNKIMIVNLFKKYTCWVSCRTLPDRGFPEPMVRTEFRTECVHLCAWRSLKWTKIFWLLRSSLYLVNMRSDCGSLIRNAL